MKRNNSIILGIGAMLALCISLPLEWMIYHYDRLLANYGSQVFKGAIPSPENMTLKITGISGYFVVPFKAPMWLIIAVGLVGVLLALLNCLRITKIPKIIHLIPLSLSALFIVLGCKIILIAPEATVGAGILIALLGLVLGYIHAFTYPSLKKETAKEF